MYLGVDLKNSKSTLVISGVVENIENPAFCAVVFHVERLGVQRCWPTIAAQREKTTITLPIHILRVG